MNLISFTIRVPKDLNKWLIQQAKLHNRSKTQEIVNILTLTKRRSEVTGDSRDEQWLALKGE